MPGYISESIRHYRLAEQICAHADDLPHASYAVVTQAAFYVEAVLNDVIFTWHQNEKHGLPNFRLDPALTTIDPLDERVRVLDKFVGIAAPGEPEAISVDTPYIEIKHLYSLRNGLAHLKPTEQRPDGTPLFLGPRKPLNHLFNQGLISDPFGRGVFWADVIGTEVAEWALATASNAIGYLYDKTFIPPFGIHVLGWQCQLLAIRRFDDDSDTNHKREKDK